MGKRIVYFSSHRKTLLAINLAFTLEWSAIRNRDIMMIRVLLPILLVLPAAAFAAGGGAAVNAPGLSLDIIMVLTVYLCLQRFFSRRK